MTESLTTPRKTQGWKKPVAITVAVAMVVAAVGYAYASPYIAVNRYIMHFAPDGATRRQLLQERLLSFPWGRLLW